MRRGWALDEAGPVAGIGGARQRLETSVLGATLTLDIVKPAAGGRMLARHQGQVVLVDGAIPGERVRARVDRVGKGLAFAHTVEVLQPSADRREGGDRACGGNLFAHIAYTRQTQLKAEIIADAFARIARFPLAEPPRVRPSPEHGYRMRTRLHVQGGRLGFFREASHELCDAAATGQLLPATAEWVASASDRLQASNLAQVSTVELAEDVSGAQRVCHLELEPGSDPQRWEVLQDGLQGLSAHAPGSAPVVLAGSTVISDVLHARAGDRSAAYRLRRDVRAFFQGNRYLLEAMVQQVVALVAAGPAVDLYAGVGLFGLALAAAGHDAVTLVEGDATSVRDLQENASALAGLARVEATSVEAYLRACPPVPTSLIVDPPRTGLSRAALAGVIAMAPGRLVYVSCDVATLARDARALLDAGWRLDAVTGLDLFPNTAHVETLAVFDR